MTNLMCYIFGHKLDLLGRDCYRCLKTELTKHELEEFRKEVNRSTDYIHDQQMKLVDTLKNYENIYLATGGDLWILLEGKHKEDRRTPVKIIKVEKSVDKRK